MKVRFRDYHYPGLALRSAIIAIASSQAYLAQAQTSPPDYIIYNAHVITGDESFSQRSAVAVRNGLFSAVGDDRSVLATAGPETRRIDLNGRTVMPGFTDAHTHTLAAKSLLLDVDLTNVRSIAELKSAIAARARTAKPGEWINTSRGWWAFNFPEKRNPTKADLDEAAPNNPVALAVTHFMIANSAALKAAGITRDTPDPKGGLIEKDPRTGEPTGILFDKAGYDIRRLIPKPTADQAYQGMREQLRRLNAKGVVAVREMGGTQADAQLFRQLYANGDLSVRIDFCYSASPQQPKAEIVKQLDALGAPGHELGAGMFRSDCVAEVGIDGATGMTALVRQDYPGKPGYRGVQMQDQAQTNMFFTEVARRFWRPVIHASGDAGIDQALIAFETANKDTRIVGRRWSLAHGNTLQPDHYERVKALGLTITSQYAHLSEGGLKTLQGLGQARADETQRFKDWLANGIEFSSGSDGPISYKSDPLFWMYGLVTRKTDWGGSIGPDQGITREQAIRSFTSIPPRDAFQEDVRGSIEAGKYADFVVVDQNVLTAPIEVVRDTKVLATVVGGKTVFGRLSE
jgi:predicted amidohydrolase YtcJ